MSLVATLVSSPADPQVTDRLIASVSRRLGGDAHRVLAEGIAADIAVGDYLSRSEAMHRVAEVVGEVAVDFAVLPTEGRRKKLLVADMDSTMIGQECIDELAAFVGLKEHVAAITERAMRGEIAFEPALRERVALLKGLDTSVVNDVLRERITLTPGGRELIATMRAHGAYTALVSGGFTLFTDRIRDRIGFDEDRSNCLLTEDGKLSGFVAEPILGKAAKLATLIELREARGLAHHETVAIGDGANDLDMINESGLGVAYHAKPKVAEAAEVSIRHGDLTAVLYLQGFAREDFAAV
ncbi:phosphoserine phosphatase SerB [Pleomorphomonas diazotrophica]|uniref:Phosphoserine phosphatase n=1 Tax=Pleomorphomonas diazotrophica TaxID=1166257 RepID=A0A1I4VFK9_9HYPH|nr:phosphoserine phosphatase SerB [Pleomorphomonas diazotrophica]PKR90079.1 phosphoserine phosphatase SerB [Pleomorphomonas diazotrophica]SFN00017.1 phosphoserine phosphatase [Pleomorphomonas diazotrophica]